MNTSVQTPAYKILFLEDNFLDVLLMTRELKKAGIGYVERKVIHREDFISSLTEFRPDLIISDYSLPSFNGMEAFHIFKAYNIAIPFLLVSGSMREEDTQKCLSEGVDCFLQKSDFHQLPAVMTRALEAKKLEREKVDFGFKAGGNIAYA
ncbi:MAG: response regulator [Bacteroidia bacterium]